MIRHRPCQHLRRTDNKTVLVNKGVKRYRVKYVGKELKDYAGMNHYAAKAMGFPKMKKDELLIDKDLPKKTKEETIKHEIVEAELMKKGMPYWRAHGLALKKEKDKKLKIKIINKNKDKKKNYGFLFKSIQWEPLADYVEMNEPIEVSKMNRTTGEIEPVKIGGVEPKDVLRYTKFPEGINEMRAGGLRVDNQEANELMQLHRTGRYSEMYNRLPSPAKMDLNLARNAPDIVRLNKERPRRSIMQR